MAIIKGALRIQGRLENVSYYTRRGSDQIIARSINGPTKERLATDPKYKEFRKHQNEWKGCTRFGSLTRYAFGGLHRLADYNLTPVLNKMAKELMKPEPVTDLGHRQIRLSCHKQAMENFNFNRENPFNSVLRVDVAGTIDRANLQATVAVPRINAKKDLMNTQRLHYFRLIVVIGTVADMHFDEDQNEYVPAVKNLHGTKAVLNSPWYSYAGIVSEQTMSVQMTEEQQSLLTDEITVLLSMAVEFGTVGTLGDTEAVKYAGSGKVLASR